VSYECVAVPLNKEAERTTVRTPLALNALMFAIGMTAGYIAQSSGMIADALDMGTDIVSYAIALMAITRSVRFKRRQPGGRASYSSR
jgi:Co/Zn/Cd efflux system component